MSRRNLAVADLSHTADINDKLAVLDELTQRLTDLGYADASIIATGILGLMNGGSGANLSRTGGANQVVQQAATGAAFTVGQLAAAMLSDGTTGSGAIVLATSPAIVTPTIASFTNAQHNHTNAAGGGQITTAALSDYVAGTWAPARNAFTEVIGGGTITQTGRYTKIGNKVFVHAEITAAGGATIAAVSGTSYLSGLPYSPVATFAGEWVNTTTENTAGFISVRATGMFVVTAWVAATATWVFDSVYSV